MPKKLSALGATLALILAAIILPAHADDPAEFLEVTLTAPTGVPVTAELTSSTRHVLAKAAGEDTLVQELPRDNYTLTASPLVWEGKRYEPSTLPPSSITTDLERLEVTWVLASGVQDLAVHNASDTEVGFTWTGGEGLDLQLRRTLGENAPTTPSEGEAVPTGSSGAQDAGLTPGTTYAYTLFQDGSPAYSLVLGTSDEEAELSTSFVREYSATFLDATPPGQGRNGNLVLEWPADTPLPLLGSGVVVPVSDDLPGGYVGTARSISHDGTHVELAPGGFSDVLAFMNMESKNYPPEKDDSIPGPPPGPKDPADDNDKPHNQPGASRPQPGAERPEPPPSRQAPARPQGKPTKLPNTGGNALKSCFQVGSEHSIHIKGHEFKADAFFRHKFDKYLWNFPTELQLETYVALTAQVTLDAAVKASGSCSLPGFDKIALMFHPGGVPTMLLIEPIAEARFEGNFVAENLRIGATLGFRNYTTIGVGGSRTETTRIGEGKVPEPRYSDSGSLALRIGGSLTFGPGVGNQHVGAVAGLSGELTVLRADATFTRTEHAGAVTHCASIGASGEAALKLSAKAWAPFVGYEAAWEIWKGSMFYGQPWTFPQGCDQAKVAEDVLGDGVTKEEETTTGSSGQRGRVEGFVPGQKTWVLSTGYIHDAVGQPDYHASSSLEMPGDEELSALVGAPTHDAVSYTLKLIPTGAKLFVRYVFASEEYPEYVGSEYNDIMRITVNGHSCAHVPGTDIPVSVNTINDQSNPQYFVDNRGGRSGYGTTMDGITVPLTCSVPVTPGQEATVVIKLADTSDDAYDSAVALLDRGIWSE